MQEQSKKKGDDRNGSHVCTCGMMHSEGIPSSETWLQYLVIGNRLCAQNDVRRELYRYRLCVVGTEAKYYI